jgi:hypothetical protein
VKPLITTLANIVGMAVPAQAALLALPNAGHWNFAIAPGTPPVGSVLRWPLGGTHAAVVAAANAITGYNQPGQFPVFVGNVGHTTGAPWQLALNQRTCDVIAEATIVAQAGALNL